jgi:hypothetical protein
MGYDHVVTKRLRLARGRQRARHRPRQPWRERSSADLGGAGRRRVGGRHHARRIPLVLLFVATPLRGRATEIPLPSTPARPRARGVGEPERRLVLPVRQGRQGRGERWFESAPSRASRSRSACRFPWGSKLSASPDEADVGVVRAEHPVPESWRGSASSSSSARPTGRRAAGSTASRSAATGRLHAVRAGADEDREARPGQRLVLRVDDSPHASSSKASRATARRAASGRRRTSRRVRRSSWTRSRSTRASRRSASSCASG